MKFVAKLHHLLTYPTLPYVGIQVRCWNNIVAITLLQSLQAFKGLQTEDSLSLPSSPSLSCSTPMKASTEEVYESEPIPDAEEEVWREVADRIDPQGSLVG